MNRYTHLICVLTATALSVAMAAVPLRWTVETSRLTPVVFDAVRGESLALEAAFNSYGKPLSMAAKPVAIFWQTNGMAATYWQGAATATSNRIAATFTPQMDPGAASVTGFLGATGDIYRAAFTLRFRNGPGAVPNVITQPPPVLDLARTVVINPPWPTQADYAATTTVMRAELKAYVDQEIEGAGLVTHQAVTNIAVGVIQEAVDDDYLCTVDKAFESDWVAYETATSAIPYVITNHVTDGYLARKTSGVPGWDGVVGTNFMWNTVGTQVERWGVEYARDAKTARNAESATLAAAVGEINSSTGVNKTFGLNDAKTQMVYTDGSVTLTNAYVSDIISATNATLNAANQKYLSREAHEFGMDLVAEWNSAFGGLEIRSAPAYPSSGATYGEDGIYSADWSVSFRTDERGTMALQEDFANVWTKAQSDQKYAQAATVGTLQSQVNAIGAHLNAEDAHFVSTNYDSSVFIPEAYVEIKMSNTWMTIWREMTRWNRFAGDGFDWNAWQGFHAFATNVTSELEVKADRAWGAYDSETGGWSPDGYTQISSSNILIAAGMAYQRKIVTGGAVWVLQCNTGVAHVGSDTNGFFRIYDGEGNVQFEIVKGDKRELGADASGITVNNATTPPTVTIPYSVEADAHPKLKICADLNAHQWKDEDDAGCVANVSWSGTSGAWVATVQAKAAPAPQLFVAATYMTGGETYINNIAPVAMQYIYLGGHKYSTSVKTIGGETVLGLTLAD